MYEYRFLHNEVALFISRLSEKREVRQIFWKANILAHSASRDENRGKEKGFKKPRSMMTAIFNAHTYKISRNARGKRQRGAAYVNFNRLRSHDNYMVHTHFKADPEISVYINVF